MSGTRPEVRGASRSTSLATTSPWSRKWCAAAKRRPDYPRAMAAASGGAPSPNVAVTAWNLLLEAVAGEVVEELRRAGQRSLLIKGVTIGRWLYPDEPRLYSDVDLLVDPASFDDCESVLVRLGFERSELERAFVAGRPSHASTWIRGS